MSNFKVLELTLEKKFASTLPNQAASSRLDDPNVTSKVKAPHPATALTGHPPNKKGKQELKFAVNDKVQYLDSNSGIMEDAIVTEILNPNACKIANGNFKVSPINIRYLSKKNE